MTKRSIEERTSDARTKLSLMLGTLQGQAMRETHEHLALDHVMLSTVVNGETFAITWGELALCAGADAFAGPELLTPYERDQKMREIARDICREFGFPVPGHDE